MVSPWFDYFIIFAILVNCVILVLNNPPEEAEYIFIVVFTIEAIGKIFGLGFIPYIKDHWNKLDFFVVLLGFVALVPAAGNYTAIRALKVLRVLKAVTIIPGLKMMVLALFQCVAAMGTVLIPVLFAVVLFAVFGLHLYVGKLRWVVLGWY